jgi:cytochrome c-type biogenesis protein CcmH
VRLLPAVLAALVLAAPAAAPAAAAAATPRASLPDIEDEVMCVQCGTALNISESPVADRERAFIRRRIALGENKAQIKRELAAAYGSAVLAMPDDGGFDLTVYLVPGLLVALGLAGVALAARRWRRTPRAAEGPEEDPPLDPDDARRLDAELAAFDRR